MKIKPVLCSLIAVIFALTFTACDEGDENSESGENTDPKTLVIQGVPNYFFNNNVDRSLSGLGIFPNGTTPEQALSMTGLVAGAEFDNSDIIVSGTSGSLTVAIPLYIPSGGIRWNGSGQYMIYTGLSNNDGVDRYFRMGPVNFSSANTTVMFNSNMEIFP